MSSARSDRIRVSCPHCRHHGNLSVDWSGSQRVRCKRCNGCFYPDTDRSYVRSHVNGRVATVIQISGPVRIRHADSERLLEDIRCHPMFDEDLDVF
jgi:hypothetical protein